MFPFSSKAKQVTPPKPFNILDTRDEFAKAGVVGFPDSRADIHDTLVPIDYSPSELIWYAENCWLVGACVDRIKNECTKYSYEFWPKFKSKCPSCLKEYEDIRETCECGYAGEFTKPDPEQIKTLKDILDKGYGGRTFTDIIGGCIYYSKLIDDWYLWLDGMITGTKPTAIVPLDSQYMKPVWNPRGTLGTDEYFCPVCYGNQSYENFIDKHQKGKEYANRKCPECNGKLELTAYIKIDTVKNINNTDRIIGRWTEREIIHSNSRSVGGKIIGTPPLISIKRLVEILIWAERYQLSAYRDNRLPDSVLAFPGMSQEELNTILKQFENMKKRNPSKRASLAVATGQGNPSVPSIVQTTPNFVDLQAIDMFNFIREAIAIRFGVSLTFMGIQTAGKLGDDTEQLEVSYNTIIETQRQVMEPFKRITELFGITDYYLRLKPPSMDTDRVDAETEEIKARTMATLKSANIDFDYSDGDIIIRDVKKPMPVPVNPFTDKKPVEEETPEEDLKKNEFEKELSPRNIPADDRVTGLATAENKYLSDMIIKYNIEVDKVIKNFSGMSEAEKDVALANLEQNVKEQIYSVIRKRTEDIYRIGMESEYPDSVFEQVDESAIYLLANDPSVFNAVTTFSEGVRVKMNDVIRQAYAQPGGLGMKEILDNMRTVASGETWKLERIIRTDTSKISNLARINQWKKYGVEDDDYEWVIAPDDRLCESCRNMAYGGTVKVWGNEVYAHGNPYKLNEIESMIPGLTVHANERCTVVRRPKNVTG